jgi:hypothetical protein
MAGLASRLRVKQTEEQAKPRDDEAKGHNRDARAEPGQHGPFGREVYSGIVIRFGHGRGGCCCA